MLQVLWNVVDEAGFEPPASSLRTRKINSLDAVMQLLASNEGALKLEYLECR